MSNLRQKLLVGVTQRIDIVTGRAEYRDALDQRLARWMVCAGFLPVPVPNTFLDNVLTEPLLEQWLGILKPNAIILSGGNDIGECPARDATERRLLSWAEKEVIPVLGICRGMQMMAVWAGAILVRREGHVGCRHRLFFPELDNWPEEVNSYHNWVVETCPDGFEVMAQTQDGSIEAIRHVSLPWEGWMWHPEREEPFSSNDILRLERLFCGQ